MRVLVWIAIAAVAIGVGLWQRGAQRRWQADVNLARRMRRQGESLS